MKTIKEILQNSIHTGELINIIYNGGSEPGASRMIMPIAIEGKKVKARCYKTNTVKCFFLEKITLAQSDKINYTGEHKEPETLTKALEPHMEELKQLGWEIEADDIQAGLFDYFKNGKRRKTATVGISDTNFHWVNGQYEAYGSFDRIVRHWYVDGHAFKYLSKAIDKFMEFAREKHVKSHLELQ